MSDDGGEFLAGSKFAILLLFNVYISNQLQKPYIFLGKIYSGAQMEDLTGNY